MGSVVVYSQPFKKFNQMHVQQLPANLKLHEARTEVECTMICGSSVQEICYGFRFINNGEGVGNCQIFSELEEYLSMTPTFIELSEEGTLICKIVG